MKNSATGKRRAKMSDPKQPLPAPAIASFKREEFETPQVFTGTPSAID